jgi:L-fucose mutarotase
VINGQLTHPEVLRALASSGHSGKVLITDAHFPISTGVAAGVPRVFLNYAPGLLTVADVLRPLVEAVPIEAAHGAVHDDDRLPDIWPEYLEILPAHVKPTPVRASDLGALVSDPGMALVIATAELRTHACIVLTLGLRR